ncbi:hypothetical protein [Sphingobium baderi]|uniref:Growth inhibitor PemK n=1 Tax=Sphingobium baderi LL03 TaxID=1114964 RepID=T0GWJ9_9SPHN|nr:hypothetical protein [Sphingobium baderi]EQB05082.1 hypothetical protein L485_02910 [Sphingobium baderi LL03]KMS60084.1 hypothetical protein V475_19655 [Sphingobium baderi LL03]
MTPLPKVGDILHYVFLFTHDKAVGRDEGIKTRPVMVAAVKDQRVFTVAITTKGEASVSTLPIPDAVADAAGLVRGTAVVIDQYNHFTWLGYDIRPVTSEPSFVAGRMPPGFTNSILSALLANAASINRD